MHPKIKQRPAGLGAAASPLKPLLLHERADPASANAVAVSRRRQIATQPASGTANHARHHVSRHTQS
jgi:hypothetical protein